MPASKLINAKGAHRLGDFLAQGMNLNISKDLSKQTLKLWSTVTYKWITPETLLKKKIKELYTSLIINHSESTFCSSQPISPKHLSVGFCSQGIWTLSIETELLKKSSSPDVFQGAMVPMDMLWEPLGKEKGICWWGLRASVLTIISESVIGWG